MPFVFRELKFITYDAENSDSPGFFKEQGWRTTGSFPMGLREKVFVENLKA
jgi:hypothetical protein